VGVDGSLWPAGRARGVKPETHVVAHGRRGHRIARRAGQQSFELFVPVRVRARHDDVRAFRGCRDRLGEFWIKLIGDDQKPCAAVVEHEAVIVRGEQRVERHRHHAGLDRPEERRRPIDGIEKAKEHALLAAEPERTQHMAEALDALGEVAVGPTLVRRTLAVIDVSKLAGAAGAEIALEDVGGEIVVALRRSSRSSGRRIWLHDIHRRFPPG